MANAEQIALWNASSGDRWVRLRAEMNTAYGEHGLRVLATAELAPGETVLDIGCGAGAVTLEAAARVGATGMALGVDVSAPLLTCARESALRAAIRSVRFEQGDVQTADLGVERFDAAVSRLGVMFFDDPVAAFSNVCRALKKGGRLAFVAWQAIADNPWISLAQEATARLVPQEATDASGPGPFSLASEAHLRGILDRAGFTAVRVESLHLDVCFGAEPRAAAVVLSQFGPLGRELAAAPQPLQERAIAAVEAALGPYITAGGVRFPSRSWLVRAARL